MAASRKSRSKRRRQPERMRFTAAAVKNLNPPKTGRVNVWDTQMPGFGLRISAPRPGSREGRKTWIAMGRINGKPVMTTIGTLVQIPDVAEARELARISLLKMKRGTKPLDERKAEQARIAAEAKQADEQAREAMAHRFELVAQEFIAASQASNLTDWSPKYAREVARIFSYDIFPAWRNKQVRDITKRDVEKLLEAKANGPRGRPRKGVEGGAKVQANRMLARLRRFFAWAMEMDYVDTDPTIGVKKRVHEEARDRVLNRDEIVYFWRAAEGLGWPSGRIFQLLLLTAQREGEVAGMRWSELDLDERLWTIPGERAKNGKSHLVHLSDLAMEIIGSLPRQGELVFPTRTGRPLSAFTQPKRRVDET